eukprot:gene584-1244_t
MNFNQLDDPKRIKIKIRRTTYETYLSTLQRFPNTLLGSTRKRLLYYDDYTDCIVFNDRSTCAFDSILYYYQSYGSLIRPPWLTMQDFERECRFFDIEETAITRMKEREGYFRVENEDDKAEKRRYELSSSCRNKLWLFFEYPESSFLAHAFAIISFLFIALSVSLTCVTTIPSVKRREKTDLFSDEYFLIELVLNSFFMIEYVCRLLCAPKVVGFVFSPLNLIDLTAIFPYFVILCIDPIKVSTVEFLKIIRTVRVLRLFRLTKQSKTVHTVMVIMSQCINDLFTVFICLFITTVISASLQYYTELNVKGTAFTSIPESMWWAIQTLVCLGYGDIIPISSQGKLVASAVSIFGAITLTVPLLSIGGRYLIMYSKQFEVPIGEDMDGIGNQTPGVHRALSPSAEEDIENAPEQS